MMRLLVSLLAFFALISPVPLAAQSLGQIVKARVLPGWKMPDGTHMAALHITLSDGWKTYWRAPGDAGIPPRFDWRASRNLRGVEVSWPAPAIILQSGVHTIGYSGSLTLPLKLSAKTPGRPITLAGEVEIGVCKEVCVPVSLSVSQLLPLDTTKPDPRIAAALASRPYTGAEAGLTHISCRITPIEDGLHIRAEIGLPPLGGREMVVVETDNPAIWVAQSKSTRANRRLVAETEMYHVEGRAFAVNRSGLTVTVLGGKHVVEIEGCPAG